MPRVRQPSSARASRHKGIGQPANSLQVRLNFEMDDAGRALKEIHRRLASPSSSSSSKSSMNSASEKVDEVSPIPLKPRNKNKNEAI